MANDEHLEILHRGVAEWNGWRIENPTIEPDLIGAELLASNFSNVNFKRVDLSGADLKDANFDGSNLTGADLRGADLSGATLTMASLYNVNFRWATLRNSKLMRSSLDSSEFYHADLNGANLSGCHLSQVNFGSASLAGANFTAASCWETIFADNDLSLVIGLDSITHNAPSTVGVDTLYRSRGKLPEVFLRGAGVPENLITFLASLTGNAIEFYSCFISYSHADKSFARRLHDALQSRGVRCWLDDHELLPGDKTYTEVDRGIRLWDKVLLCCSKAALTSWWVDNEIKIAFDKEQQLWRQRGKEVLALIPLNLDDYLFSGKWQSGLETEVKARLAANFVGWESNNKKFEEQFEQLVKALRTNSGGKKPPPPALL